MNRIRAGFLPRIPLLCYYYPVQRLKQRSTDNWLRFFVEETQFGEENLIPLESSRHVHFLQRKSGDTDDDDDVGP